MLKRPTLEEYMALPHPERNLLRRLAFGAVPPPCFVCTYDINHIRTILVQENERTGDFGTKWTSTIDDLDDLIDDVPDVVDVIQLGAAT